MRSSKEQQIIKVILLCVNVETFALIASVALLLIKCYSLLLTKTRTYNLNSVKPLFIRYKYKGIIFSVFRDQLQAYKYQRI